MLSFKIRSTRRRCSAGITKSHYNQSIDRSRNPWWRRRWDTLGACGEICRKEETESICAAESGETETISNVNDHPSRRGKAHVLSPSWWWIQIIFNLAHGSRHRHFPLNLGNNAALPVSHFETWASMGLSALGKIRASHHTWYLAAERSALTDTPTSSYRFRLFSIEELVPHSTGSISISSTEHGWSFRIPSNSYLSIDIDANALRVCYWTYVQENCILTLRGSVETVT